MALKVTQKASRKHPGGTQEAPRRYPAGTQEGPKRHPGHPKLQRPLKEGRCHFVFAF